MKNNKAWVLMCKQEMYCEKDTVKFSANYDDSTTEPTVVPAGLPNLLLNGSVGIAVGMATSIPTHNLGEVIDAVISCINEGINTKMLLAEAASERSGASKRSTLQLIEKYAGDDPVLHRWFFVRGERGKQVFTILDISSPGQSLSEAKSEA